MNDGGLNPLTEGLLKKDFSKDSNKNENENKKNKKNTSYPTVSFVAVGDNIIHENVYQYALKQGNDTTYNFKPCYQNIKKYILIFKKQISRQIL